MANATTYDGINWFTFKGLIDDYWNDLVVVGTPTDDQYRNRGENPAKVSEKVCPILDSVLVNSSYKALYYMLAITGRQKTPAKKRFDTSDVSTINGVHMTDLETYGSGSVTYDCVLMPQTGYHYTDTSYVNRIFANVISYLSQVKGYGTLKDSYENRWCYAYFSGVDNVEKYKDTMTFSLSFVTKPEWYYGTVDDIEEIADFSKYPGRSSASDGVLSTSYMYNIYNSSLMTTHPMLLITPDSTASSWSLYFPRDTSIYNAATDLCFKSSFTSQPILIDCGKQGAIMDGFTETKLDKAVEGNEPMFFPNKEFSEWAFDVVPERYPTLKYGSNWCYGSGIKSMKIYKMRWTL